MAGTLADMKTRIEDELGRADLPNHISNAIDEAISYYQNERFYFNERNDVLFDTVADQTEYGITDNPYIPVAYDVDDMFIKIGVNEYRVKRVDPTRWRLIKNDSTKGQPFQYAYFNQTISLYPTPTQVYEMRIVGKFKINGPASDAETGNPWMVDAEPLIRHRSKMLVYRDVLQETQKAAVCASAEQDALSSLRAVTSSLTRTGMIEPSQF